MKRKILMCVLSILMVAGLGACEFSEEQIESLVKEYEQLGKITAEMKNNSEETMNYAGYAKFAQEFGSLGDNLYMASSEMKLNIAVVGFGSNNAQCAYMFAKGIPAEKFEELGIKSQNVPADEINKSKMNDIILEVLGYEESDRDNIAAYPIEKLPEGYKQDFKLYGDVNGKETIYITSDKKIFTLPGYPMLQPDGSKLFYVTSNLYYSVIGTSGKTTSDVDENGIKYQEAPITAEDFTQFESIRNNFN